MLLKGRNRIVFLCSLTILLIFSGFWASQLKFSFEFEEFFSTNDPDIKFFKQAQKEFVNGDEILTIGLTNSHSVFEQEFLNKLDEFEKKVSLINGVEKSISLISLKNPVKGIFKVKEVPFFDLARLDKITEDSIYFFSYPDVHPKFVSPDRRSTCMFLILEEEVPKEMISQVFKLLENSHFKQYNLYGLSVAQDSYEDSLKSEMIWLSLLAFIMIIVITYFSYRSVLLLVIAILFLGSTLLLTLGVAFWIGSTLNVLTITIPPIIAIVSMSDLIHIFSRFVEEDRKAGIEDRIRASYKDIGKSLMLTSFTTATGFLGLVFTDVVPFIHFGVITSLGVLIAYLLTIYFAPILIFYISQKSTFKNWSLSASGLVNIVFNHQKKILALAGVLLISSLYFGSKVEINTYLFDDLDAEDPLSKTLAFFEKNFFGIRDLELYVTVKEPYYALDDEVIRKLDDLETYLSEVYGAQSVYSIATQVKRLNRMNYGGLPHKYEVPERKVVLRRLLDEVVKEKANPLVRSLVSEDLTFTRIQVKSTDWGSAITKLKNDSLQHFLNNTIDPNLMEVKLSGKPLFLDRSNEEITNHLFFSLMGALLIVLTIIGILYKSFKMSLIALIPNVLPLIIMLLIMYWLDISLKKSTAVVFTIAFGIAVDDTIHFLGRLKTELSRQVPIKLALQKTIHSTGKAILITSILLIGGFGSFAFSTFQSTFLTGTLISVALFTALIADLVLLPALILYFFKDN